MEWPGGGLGEWLRGRPDAELTTLLDSRPDVAAARSFDELADRLCAPWSVRLALESADAAMLQLIEVLQAFGGVVTAERLERFLQRPPGPALDGYRRRPSTVDMSAPARGSPRRPRWMVRGGWSRCSGAHRWRPCAPAASARAS